MCCTVIYYVGCYNILVITVSINVRVVSLKYIYFFVSFRLLSVVSYYLLVVSLGIGVLDSISVVLFVEVIYVVFFILPYALYLLPTLRMDTVFFHGLPIYKI